MGTPELSGRRLNKLLYLAGCLVLVAMLRLGLALFSYTTLRRLIPTRRPSSVEARQESPEVLRQVRWGVAKAARVVPYATCLTKALAVEFLLGWHGQQAEVHIGVAKGDGGQLCAHAWVTSSGRVVIGGPVAELERYTRLMRTA